MTALNLGYMLKSDKPFAIQALGVIVFALLNIRPLVLKTEAASRLSS
jgi:hypothetical protein